MDLPERRFPVWVLLVVLCVGSIYLYMDKDKTRLGFNNPVLERENASSFSENQILKKRTKWNQNDIPKPLRRGSSEYLCKSVDFRSNMPLIALNSFQGSGNTWIRYLIERATGVYTGSVYCDRSVQNGGFRGECKSVDCGCVVAVKIHGWHGKESVYPWKKCILVIRNPYDALIADFNRVRSKGHTKNADEDMFRGTGWNSFVSKRLPDWLKIPIDAMTLFGSNILVIHYEDLKRDVHTHLKRIVKFLGIDNTSTPERVRCAADNLRGNFKRVNKSLSFDPFTQEQYANVNASIQNLVRLLKLARLPLPPYADTYLPAEV